MTPPRPGRVPSRHHQGPVGLSRPCSHPNRPAVRTAMALGRLSSNSLAITTPTKTRRQSLRVNPPPAPAPPLRELGVPPERPRPPRSPGDGRRWRAKGRAANRSRRPTSTRVKPAGRPAGGAPPRRRPPASHRRLTLTSGLVRKSPALTDRKRARGEVPALGVVEGSLHERIEPDGALGSNPLDQPVLQDHGAERWRSITPARGGRVSPMENGRPCVPFATASTSPRLPWPLPP